jgi:transposase
LAHDAIQASARRRKALGIRVWAIRRIPATYKRQLVWDIERTFRTTKSLLETRLIYHKLNETIRDHVACSFLALVLKKELEDRLAVGAKSARASWPEVIADLDSLTETEVEQDGKRFLIRSAPRPAAALALSTLGVALPPTLRQTVNA